MKLTILGDVMFDNAMTQSLDQYRVPETGELDFTSIFSETKDLLGKADSVIANLETPITEDLNDLTCKKWTFCTAIAFAKAVKNANIPCVTTANNHCLDRGTPGIENTIRCLDKTGLIHTGLHSRSRRRKLLLLTVNGIRFGVLSYTYGTNAFSNNEYLRRSERRMVDLLQEQEEAVNRGKLERPVRKKYSAAFLKAISKPHKKKVNPENEGKQIYEKVTRNHRRLKWLARDIRKLKQAGADHIIGCMHIGGQYNMEPSLYTRRTASWLKNRGCNIVICNHEHVIHGSTYSPERDEITAFALGNFVGAAGTLHGPYDRRAEYSIALHLYLDENTKKMKKVTFSVLKAVLSDAKTYKVWEASDLYGNLKTPEERAALEKETLDCAADFSGKTYSAVQEEFEL